VSGKRGLPGGVAQVPSGDSTSQGKRGQTVQSCSVSHSRRSPWRTSALTVSPIPVVPSVAALVFQRSVGAGVGVPGVVDQRFGLFEVGTVELRPLVGERPCQRVPVMEVKPTARGYESADLRRPVVNAREPAQRTAAHELGSLSEPGALGDAPCRHHRRRGEIKTGHSSACPRPRQRVQAKVATAGGAGPAHATQAALDAGAAQVVLYTDLANPTSNAIYQSIGYLPDHDAVERSFVRGIK
jgi:hypothetical protein